MRYFLFLLMFLSLVACRGENDEEYNNSVRVSRLDMTTTYLDLKIDVYRTTYNGYVVYETFYSHTQETDVYYFSYKLQLVDVNGLVMVESDVLTVNQPEVFKIYQGISLPINNPNWYPTTVVPLVLTAYDVTPVAN